MRYTFGGPVRYSEVDEYGRLSLGGLVNYFQDTSTFHSEQAGYGVRCLKQKGQAWILASWQIVIDSLPFLGDQISVATWAYDFRDFYGMRNYLLTDRGGEALAWANAIWLLYDMNSARPVRVSREMAAAFAPEERYAMTYAPRKIAASGDSESKEHFFIGKNHLDTNHHVNNGQYIQFAQNELPEGAKIRQVRAEYRAQARLGDEICPRVLQAEDKTTVSLENVEGRPYALVEFCGDR